MDVAGHSETYGLIGVVWVIVPEKYALPSFDITVMMLVPLSPLKLKYIGSFVSRTVFSPCCTPLRSRRKVMGLSRTSLMANSKVSAPLHSATQRFFFLGVGDWLIGVFPHERRGNGTTGCVFFPVFHDKTSKKCILTAVIPPGVSGQVINLVLSVQL